MSSTERRVLFARKIAQLIQWAFVHDIALMPYRFHTTLAEDLIEFLAGRSEIDPRKTPTPHMVWEAMDLVIIKDGMLIWTHIPEYDWLGEEWEKLGGRWGGRWKTLQDNFHFELGAA
jgi:hypothetical protein